MNTTSDGSSQPKPLLDLLRECLLERWTGKLAVDAGGTERFFFFVGGDVYLSADHALSRAAGAPAGGRPPTDAWIDKVLDYFDALGDVRYKRFEGTKEISTDLVGPAGAAELVMQGAVRGRDEFQLLRALGGEESVLVVYVDSALANGVGLDPEEAFLLSRLEQPTAVKELLRLSGLDSMQVARRLCRLAAVELIGPDRKPQALAKSTLVSPKLLERFKTRIAEDLDREALNLEPEAHRRKLAGLMARLGGLNYYELLGVSVGSTLDEIHAAYTRLARLVHPRHAPALGLGGREAGVDLLFERATEAYLTLSDQDRRGEYLQHVGAFTDGSLFGHTEESRKEEVTELAGRNFQMAQSLVHRQDYFYAIELLNQAIRMEARPEYFALLGRCQSQNPQWYDKAIASYGRAVQLSPNDADLRASLGAVFEKAGHKARARAQYQAALEVMPGHPDASSGMHRLDSVAQVRSQERPWWKRLFGRDRAE